MRSAHPSAPWHAVVLAVDTAKTSGFALYVRGNLYTFGEVDMLRDRESAAQFFYDAQMLVRLNKKCPSVLVYERPFRGTTQGQWIGMAKELWCASGGVQSRMLGVYPRTWRSHVLPRGIGQRREQIGPWETKTAEAVIDGDDYATELGPDSAAAICIGQWAIRAPEVGVRLPKGQTARTLTEIED